MNTFSNTGRDNEVVRSSPSTSQRVSLRVPPTGAAVAS